MKTRNGTEAPGGRQSGDPEASRKAAARRDRKTGEPAKRPGKSEGPEAAKGASPSAVPPAAPPAAQRGRQTGEPAKRPDKSKSPEAAKGASPSAAPAAAKHGRQKGEAAKRPGKSESPETAKGASPSATPAAAAQTRRDGTTEPEAGGHGEAERNETVVALARRADQGLEEAVDQASPAILDPEAALQRILLENCKPESDTVGSEGGGWDDRRRPRTGRRRSAALGRGLADLSVNGGRRVNPGLERLLGSAAGQAPPRRSGGADGPAGLSENWDEPPSGVPETGQVREALDVFVKLALERGLRDLANECENPITFGVGHMLWSLRHRGILVEEAAAFMTLRTVFGADSEGEPVSSGNALPCNRRTVIHALRHAGLLDPALSARVVKPATVMPRFRDALAAVAERFRVPASEIVGKCRRRPTIEARFAVMAVQREIAGASYARIGHAAGGRHHSTVAHAVASVERRRKLNAALDRELKACADSADSAALKRHFDMLRGAHQLPRRP